MEPTNPSYFHLNHQIPGDASGGEPQHCRGEPPQHAASRENLFSSISFSFSAASNLKMGKIGFHKPHLGIPFISQKVHCTHTRTMGQSFKSDIKPFDRVSRPIMLLFGPTKEGDTKGWVVFQGWAILRGERGLVPENSSSAPHATAAPSVSPPSSPRVPPVPPSPSPDSQNVPCRRRPVSWVEKKRLRAGGSLNISASPFSIKRIS